MHLSNWKASFYSRFSSQSCLGNRNNFHIGFYKLFRNSGIVTRDPT